VARKRVVMVSAGEGDDAEVVLMLTLGVRWPWLSLCVFTCV